MAYISAFHMITIVRMLIWKIKGQHGQLLFCSNAHYQNVIEITAFDMTIDMKNNNNIINNKKKGCCYLKCFVISDLLRSIWWVNEVIVKAQMTKFNRGKIKIWLWCNKNNRHWIKYQGRIQKEEFYLIILYLFNFFFQQKKNNCGTETDPHHMQHKIAKWILN